MIVYIEGEDADHRTQATLTEDPEGMELEEQVWLEKEENGILWGHWHSTTEAAE